MVVNNIDDSGVLQSGLDALKAWSPKKLKIFLTSLLGPVFDSLIFLCLNVWLFS